MEKKFIAGGINLLLIAALGLIIFYSSTVNPSEYIFGSVLFMIATLNLSSTSRTPTYITEVAKVVRDAIVQFKYITPTLYVGSYFVFNF